VSGEKAVFFRPDSLEANLLLGMAYRSVKNFEKAEASLKRAWNVSDGSSADVHWHLALLYGKDLNRFAEAAKELEHYLEVAGDIPNEEAVRKLIKHFKTKAVEQQSSR
jgi:tetratricopeptide (TPR) repeat protein